MTHPLGVGGKTNGLGMVVLVGASSRMGALDPDAFFAEADAAAGAVEEDFVEMVFSALTILRLTTLVAFLPPYESSSSLSSFSLSSWSSSSSLAMRFLEVEVSTAAAVEDISTLLPLSVAETRAEALVAVARFVTMVGVINLDRGNCKMKL